jgi:uncharacterized protein involved in exopolysaccharide biosynthesis
MSTVQLSDRQEDVDLLTMWRALWARRWIIIVCAIVGTAVAAVMAMIAPSIYHAEVIVTEARDPNMGGSGSIAGQLGGLASLAGMNVNNSGPANEARAILKSRKLVEDFITRNELVTKLVKGGDSPSLWLAVRRFRDDVISIREDQRQGTTTVAIEWTDPVTTARWANGFVALANELIRQRALTESNRNVTYLKTQIAQTNDVELQRVLYNLIEQETKTLMLANGRIEYAFTVVDPAVAPERRISPRRTIMVLFGAAIGLCAGIAIALTLNAVLWARR